MSRSDSIQLVHDSIQLVHNPIHFPFVQTNTAKIHSPECHLNDLLNKMTMNKEHKIHQTASNIMILFVMFDKNQFVAFSGTNAIEEVTVGVRFSESNQEF